MDNVLVITHALKVIVLVKSAILSSEDDRNVLEKEDGSFSGNGDWRANMREFIEIPPDI